MASRSFFSELGRQAGRERIVGSITRRVYNPMTSSDTLSANKAPQSHRLYIQADGPRWGLSEIRSFGAAKGLGMGSSGEAPEDDHFVGNLWGRRPGPQLPAGQVLERIGGDDGTRARGLCRDSSSLGNTPSESE